MKSILLICVTLVLGISLHAQQAYQVLSADTTKGAQTKYITATSECKYAGGVSFEFTLKGFAASDDITVVLQGSNDGDNGLAAFTKAFDIDTVAYSNNTVVNQIMFDNPAKYKRYRLKLTGAVGDTVRVYNPLFIYKR